MNDTYEVLSDSDRFYLRVYRRGWRTKPEIEAEMAMLTFLAERDQPVSRPIRRRDGAFLTRLAAPEGVRYAALFTEALREETDFSIERWHQFGALTAQLHDSLDGMPVDCRRFHLDIAHLLEEPLQVIRPYFEDSASDLTYLEQVGAGLRQLIEACLPLTRPYYGCIHGDITNVHSDRHGRMVLFDFDCYGYGWRAYEVTVVLWLLEWTAYGHGLKRGWVQRRWRAFQTGYSHVREISASEQAAITWFVPLRHIWVMALQASTIGFRGRSSVNFDQGVAFIRRWVNRHRLHGFLKCDDRDR